MWVKISDEQTRLVYSRPSLPIWGQKGSFRRPSQSQHRLRFHWPPPVHRWGVLEFDDLESWAKCWTGERVSELWLAVHKDSFISHCDHPRLALNNLQIFMQVCLMERSERSLLRPPPCKMSLSFHFASLLHLRKFSQRMFLLFSPLDIISYEVSEFTQWELGAGKQITGTGV